MQLQASPRLQRSSEKYACLVVPPKRRRHAAVRCISAAGGIGSNTPQFLANGPLKPERKKPRTCGASCSPVLRGAGGSATGEHTSILCTHHGSTLLFSRAIFSRRTRSLVALRIPKFEQLGAEPCAQLPKIGCVAPQPRSCIVSAGRLGMLIGSGDVEISRRQQAQSPAPMRTISGSQPDPAAGRPMLPRLVIGAGIRCGR